MATNLTLTTKVGASVFGAVLIIVAALMGVALIVSRTDVVHEVGLPVLAITGVVLLLASLAIMSVTFSLFGIGDTNHALGLPNGSIRAVIALSLIVLFGIFSVYFYTSVAAEKVDHVSNLSSEEAKAFRASLAKDAFVSEVVEDPTTGESMTVTPNLEASSPNTQPKTQATSGPSTPTPNTPPNGATSAPSTSQPTTSPNGASSAPNTAGTPPKPGANGGTSDVKKPDGRHTIYFRSGPSAASIDLAKQLITLIGVLVTAISSFYFGSKGSSATPAAAQQDVLDPTAVAPQNSGALPNPTLALKITGKNLGSADHVKLKLGNNEIGATKVSSNASEVTCEVALPATTANGAWDVVVLAKGKEYSLPRALTVP